MSSISVYNNLLSEYSVKVTPTSDGNVQHVTTEPFTNIIDVASATIEYYGAAVPGTATSAALWRIQRKSVSGNVTTYAWAGGAATYVNVWDNRASFSYS